MNISKSFRVGVVSSVAIVLLSGLGMNASAEENKGNDSNNKQSTSSEQGKNGNKDKEGIQNSGIRSHGHPLQDFAGVPTTSTQSSQDAFVSNDSEASEREWQAWNKKNQSNAPTGQAKTVAVTKVSSPISLHGGVPYTGNVKIYPVWVGTWDSARQSAWSSTLSNLVSSLGGGVIPASGNIFSTNNDYFKLAGNRAIPNLTWFSQDSAVAATGSSSGGITQVSDANVSTAINAAITAGYVTSPAVAIAAGIKPIYVYIGSNTTRLSSGFGTAYCGWHSFGTLTSSTAKVPFIAIQDFNSTYLRACTSSLIQKLSPNADPYLDAMASVLVHEIDEALTDTDVRTGWFDGRGAENADKCAWTFGTLKIDSPNGATYNVTYGGKYYLIQRNWLANNSVQDVISGVGNSCTINTAA
jgi:hypothetical protein